MIDIEQRGRRYYITGPTYDYRARLSQAGARWDAEAKCWWISRKATAEQIVASLNERLSEDTQREREREREAGVRVTDPVIRGRCTYEGHAYYLLADGNSKSGKPYAKLCYRDGSRIFLAKHPSKVKIVKRYSEPLSIDSMRRFADRTQRYGAAECYCRCHDERNAGQPGSTLYDGCDRCGCDFTCI